THSADLLHPAAQCLPCEKGPASDDMTGGTSNPEFPRKGVSVVAYSPSQRCSQRAPEGISHPGQVRGCAPDLVVQEKVFQHSLETPEILSLQPRQMVAAETDIGPLLKRLRFLDAHFSKLRPYWNPRIWSKDVGREADVRIHPGDLTHSAKRFQTVGLG